MWPGVVALTQDKDRGKCSPSPSLGLEENNTSVVMMVSVPLINFKLSDSTLECKNTEKWDGFGAEYQCISLDNVEVYVQQRTIRKGQESYLLSALITKTRH